MRRVRSAVGLGLSLVVTFAAAFVGGIFTRQSVSTWYQDLVKPGWTPSGWVFGPVWSVLYAMMGVSAWLVWRRVGSAIRRPLMLFAAQLMLNAAWSLLFFGLRRPDLAFAEIVLLWCLILATMLAFRPVSRLAGALLIPYLAWVTYAAALNAAIWRLNLSVP